MAAAARHPAKRRPGRPDKLTPARQRKIIMALRRGNYAVVAARLAGVDNTTLCRWMERGGRENTGPYHEFRQAVEQAQAAAEDMVVNRLVKQTPKSVPASVEYLSRRHPERWGRVDRSKIELSGQVATSPAIDPRKLSTTELETLEALLAKAAPIKPTDDEGGDR